MALIRILGPWKMYPLRILFGLGFDTSSEVALLVIASVQWAQRDEYLAGFGISSSIHRCIQSGGQFASILPNKT
jgi:hypothetical protein